MSEEAVVIEPQKSETPAPGMEIITPGGGLWSDNSWSTTLPTQPESKQTDNQSDKPIVSREKTATTTEPDEELVDEFEYLEKQTGYKSWDELKTTLSKAKEWEQKAMTPAERKFANEESKRLTEAFEAGETDKVWEYLDTQRQLKTAANLPSAEAIKLHIKQTNPTYKAADVEDVFEDRYGLPKEPRQGANEDPEDFQERMTEYKTRVEKVNRAIERDAVTAKSELAKRTTELKPPEIPNRQQEQQGPPQEVLDARKAVVDNFRKELPKQLEGVKGFTTNFKDDVAEFPVTYAVTAEELTPYKAELDAFAEKGLDVNQLFSKRWLNQDGSINIQRIGEDLYLLDNKEKVFQKIASETGVQRFKAQTKKNSNIKVDGNGKITPPEKTEKDARAEEVDYLWKNG